MEDDRLYATFHQRVLAHNIDLVLLLPFFYITGYFVQNNWLLFVLCFIIYALFHTLFEASKWRATPGKKLQRLTVQIDTTNQEHHLTKILLRNIAKSLSILPLFAGCILMLFDSKKRTLHDRIAHTVVIVDEI